MKKLHATQSAIGLSILIGAGVSAKPIQSSPSTEMQEAATSVAASLFLPQDAIASLTVDRAHRLSAFGKRTTLTCGFELYICPEALKDISGEGA